jgi:hypothetical protein
VKPPVIAILLALLVAGCGKGGTTLFSRDATSACLTKDGLRPTPVGTTSDFVANSATGGAFRVTLPGNSVTVSFGLTVDDANNINDAYHRFRAQNVGIEDVLRQDENVVMLWHVHPQDADLAAITNCLKS